MIGQHKRDLSIVPYRRGWVGLFEQEAGRLRRALGERALRLEQMGSTSIPGMEAKPIIDIMVAVDSLAGARELIPALEALGYEYKPHDIIPERLFFAKENAPEHRTHHLNLAQQDSGFWKNQLAFRDYLRGHDRVAGEYVDLKKNIARLYAQTNEIDPEAKSEFVARVLALAAKEEKGSG
jgi:GrpB-like predicted nucleotidyltransferase (UPF0157 family)